jgi:lysozyme
LENTNVIISLIINHVQGRAENFMNSQKVTKTLLLFGGILVIAVGTWGVLFYNGIVAIHEPDRQQYPIQGIDISMHQTEIDWQQLAQPGQTDFVIMKATEGGSFKDQRFTQNWQGAKQQGLVRGAYHFFTFCKPGKDQAQNFIATVPVETNTLPPVIDLEFAGNCNKALTQIELDKELNDYIQVITKTYQQQPILYTTTEFYDVYLRNKFTQYPLWISNFYSTPQLSHNRAWTFWQYTERGKAAGIPGLVDRNVFHGSPSQFKELLKNN